MYCMMYYCIISSNILRLVSTTILTKQCHGNDVHCCTVKFKLYFYVMEIVMIKQISRLRSRLDVRGKKNK